MKIYIATHSMMDKDNDAKLTDDEFNAQNKLFYFGLFNGSFSQWDRNNDAMLDQTEFITNAATTNLSTLWDTNSDKRISKKELAGGMFVEMR